MAALTLLHTVQVALAVMQIQPAKMRRRLPQRSSAPKPIRQDLQLVLWQQRSRAAVAWEQGNMGPVHSQLVVLRPGLMAALQQ